jgi:hypothetical protein
MSLATALLDLLAPYGTATIAEPLARLIAAYYRSFNRAALLAQYGLCPQALIVLDQPVPPAPVRRVPLPPAMP